MVDEQDNSGYALHWHIATDYDKMNFKLYLSDIETGNASSLNHGWGHPCWMNREARYLFIHSASLDYYYYKTIHWDTNEEQREHYIVFVIQHIITNMFWFNTIQVSSRLSYSPQIKGWKKLTYSYTNQRNEQKYLTIFYYSNILILYSFLPKIKVECKVNWKSTSTDLKCRICNGENESHEHIINCARVMGHGIELDVERLLCENIKPNDNITIRLICKRHLKFKEIIKESVDDVQDDV